MWGPRQKCKLHSGEQCFGSNLRVGKIVYTGRYMDVFIKILILGNEKVTVYTAKNKITITITRYVIRNVKWQQKRTELYYSNTATLKL